MKRQLMVFAAGMIAEVFWSVQGQAFGQGTHEGNFILTPPAVSWKQTAASRLPHKRMPILTFTNATAA